MSPVAMRYFHVLYDRGLPLKRDIVNTTHSSDNPFVITMAHATMYVIPVVFVCAVE
jgi:hypothetical protein